MIEVIANGYWKQCLALESESNHSEFVNNLRNQLRSLDANHLSMEDRSSALQTIIAANTKNVTIFEWVRHALDHPTHIKLGSPLRFDHCLALILYTATPANYDLTESQLAQNPRKWKYFDQCLLEAIQRLVDRQRITNVDLWCGLCDVFFDYSMVESKHFFLCSHQSSSVCKAVAERFRSDCGTLVKIDANSIPPHYRCDVSWLSPYKAEREVLLRRGLRLKMKHFDIAIAKKQFIELEFAAL